MKTQHTHPKVRRFAAIAALAAPMLVGLVAWYRHPSAAWQKHGRSDTTTDHILRYLPYAEFSGEVSVKIAAAPHAIYAALQAVTLNDMPIANWIGQLRYLPTKLMGKQADAPDADAESFLELVQTDGGNIILFERPGEEVILGAIGKFHHVTDQHVVSLQSPSDFVMFDQPDYQKLIMSFRITPLENGTAHRLTLVHGTHALSRAAGAKFALYWLGIKPGGNLVSWIMLRTIKRIAEQATTAVRA